ncbi:unnamed protein product, partial [Pylaiella littoralis]
RGSNLNTANPWRALGASNWRFVGITMEDGFDYMYLVTFVVLASAIGGAFVIRRSLLSEARPTQRLERRGSILAQRMAEVRRTQQSSSPEDRRPDRRRQRKPVGEEGVGGPGRGGAGRGQEEGVRPLSRRSFLAVADTASTPSPPPREDSPLLGNKKPSRTASVMALDGDGGSSGEKKDTIVDWSYMEGISPVSGGSEYGSEAGSKRTTISAAPTTLSAADEALLGTFMDVLAEGLPIKIHRSSKRPRKTTLWLQDSDTLAWTTKRAIGTKRWHKLKLSAMIRVEAGKGGANSLIIGSGEAADEDVCFSLTFPYVSMGFEATSQLERDALVQGFAMLAEDLQAVADERRYLDTEARVVPSDHLTV